MLFVTADHQGSPTGNEQTGQWVHAMDYYPAVKDHLQKNMNEFKGPVIA